MKYLLSLITLAFCLSLQSYGQIATISFGTPPVDALQMTSYEKDPDAEALVLYDKGESYFHYDENRGYIIHFTRTKRIKIFSEAGLDYGNIEIEAYRGSNSQEMVSALTAFSYNINSLGSIEKRELDISALHQQQVNEYWSVYKAAIPNVKPGTVIEYQYKFETPFLSNPPDWKFQNRIPTLYSEYVLNAIPFYEYSYAAQGMQKFDFTKSETSKTKRTFGSVVESYGRNIGSGIQFNDVIHTFVMKDIPAFRDEDYITSVEDYIQKLDFQLSVIHKPTGASEALMTDWETMIETLLESKYIGKYIDDSEKVAKKEILEQIEINGETEIHRAAQVIDYMKSNYRWNRTLGKGSTEKAKDVVEIKNGNVGELNLLLAGTLRAAGIEAKPVILSTRNNGRIKKEFPYDPSFNYVVVLVETKERAFLADVTEPLLAFDRIPLRAINDHGLILNKGARWVDLAANPVSQNLKQINISIDPETKKASSDVTFQLTEFESYGFKASYEDNPEKLKEYFEKRGFKLSEEVKTANYDRSRIAYFIQANLQSDLGQLDDKIFFNPFLNFQIGENQLTQKERNYPVDFIYPVRNLFEVRITIPEGYEIIQALEDYEISTPQIEINLKTKTEGNTLAIDAVYGFKKATYSPNEYSALKQQINLIIEKFSKEVVLQKKG